MQVEESEQEEHCLGQTRVREYYHDIKKFRDRSQRHRWYHKYRERVGRRQKKSSPDSRKE